MLRFPMTQPFAKRAPGQTASTTVVLFNVNNLTTLTHFEVHGPLTKLRTDTDHQLTRFLELFRLDDDFQPIARLFVYVTVVGNPGALKGPSSE
jgi:hypothetical protein